MLHQPGRHEHLVNFETDRFHEYHLVRLDAMLVTEANNLVAEPKELQEAHMNGLSQHKRHHVLHLLREEAFETFPRFIQVHLELVSPVFNESNAPRLA